MTAECVPATLRTGTGATVDLDARDDIAGGPAAVEHADELIEAGCSQVCASPNEARRAVRQFHSPSREIPGCRRIARAATLCARTADAGRNSGQ